jgi:hypothetical protein
VVFAIFDISFGRSIVWPVLSMGLGASQVRKTCPAGLRPMRPEKWKRAGRPALFGCCFLLPVGLADFMETDATVESASRQRVLLRNRAEKNRAFSRARPVDREEVTVSPSAAPGLTSSVWQNEVNNVCLARDGSGGGLQVRFNLGL